MNKTGFPIKGLIEDVFLPYFHKHGESAIPFLVNTSVARTCFLSAYKHLPPIEQMPEKEKREMKQFINDTFPGTTPQFRLNACKIVYTIGTLL